MLTAPGRGEYKREHVCIARSLAKAWFSGNRILFVCAGKDVA